MSDAVIMSGDSEIQKLKNEIDSQKKTIDQLTTLNKTLQSENEVSKDLLKKMDESLVELEKIKEQKELNDQAISEETTGDTKKDEKDEGMDDREKEMSEILKEVESLTEEIKDIVKTTDKVESLRAITKFVTRMKKFESLEDAEIDDLADAVEKINELEETINDLKEEIATTEANSSKEIEALTESLNTATEVIEKANEIISAKESDIINASEKDDSEIKDLEDDLKDAKETIKELADLLSEATPVVEKVESLFGSVAKMEEMAASYKEMKESVDIEMLVKELGVTADQAKYALETLGSYEKASEFLGKLLVNKSQEMKDTIDGEKLESVADAMVKRTMLKNDLSPKTTRLLNLIQKI